MMRVCHLDTCPVGVATQNPELRKRFDGRPEYVVNFMRFIAEEVREYLAQLGFRTHRRGRRARRDARHRRRRAALEDRGARPLADLPACRSCPPGTSRHQTRNQEHGLEKALDNTLIQLCEGALSSGDKVHLDLPVRNVNRTVGTMLGYELTQPLGRRGPARRHDRRHAHRLGRARASARSCPGASRCGWSATRNDYFGKGLSGGRLTLRPDPSAPFVAEDNIIAGNVILYGATSGEIFVRGVVGERFCVRNSGALAVVEGVGDHGCEYMTGGRVVVLGQDRAQLRGRHVRRHRLRARPHRDDLLGNASTPRWSTSTRSTTTTARSCATPSSGTTPRPTRPWRATAHRLGRRRRAVRQGHAQGLQAGAAGPRGRRARRPRRQRSDHGGRTWVTRRGS